ncbi:P-loop containing nucleoside triphosphate hydrolase [Plasmodium brasilianum]|uniref:p-loop containing nucleoside triphosphate hydrolase, putative n=2 Tax=Plasmodium (Plasmodium) TaxID=418103 RepID=A0A1A8WR99_PLAMA|nr:P-loop containing nucleoside triphosphate hydrolase, putative [Plasmodium malariae]KAI4838516.1 P-loop containing nucleoside triphosphate hydrolase [Plasmodium brasilianum]SBS94383.1 conserved Plasmodium protein, unknown function [Plasmodium malariae]SCN12918.1 P-loop containing nucleoside triphosphate hydrolase, putative [Plasmodium malariae]
MANKGGEGINIDCTCLDLFEEPTKTYYFYDCAILKKCIQNGALKESESVCIYGKENCGKTLLLTEIVADLTAVKELKGMNSKVVFLDCDLSFNYKNYENMIYNKFDKYISNSYKRNDHTSNSYVSNNRMSNNPNVNIINTNNKLKKENLKKIYLEKSFSNIYYMPIFNPGHLLVILNTLKILLEKKVFIEALFFDSLSFWNFCKYDKINFFSDKNYVKRNSFELLDYVFTLILNLKKKYKFLFFYTKLCNEDRFIEYIINLSINEKHGEQIKNVEKKQEKQVAGEKVNTLKQVFFLIPHNFNDILKTHIFLKKDFATNNYLMEKPFFIFLIPNEKKQFTHINKNSNFTNLNFLLCLSSEMKDKDKDSYSKFFFMITNSHTIVPL